MRITVVGAGIVGLTSALRLREARHDVQVVAEHTGDDTTSALAAALWFPYLAAPQHEVTRWATVGRHTLSDLARSEPAAGVDLRAGRQLFRAPTPDPWWAPAAPPLRRLDRTALPAGFVDGFELTVPVVDTPLHLRWLSQRLTAQGVEISRGRIGSLEDARDGADAVVNCAGLGAGELAADADLEPVRGQVVLVEQIGLSEWTLDETDPVDLTYVVPRRSTIVLGGTAVRGDDDMQVRRSTAAEIVHRAVALVPALADATVVAHRVGLRPARSTVRLERVRDVVHCYGHGGAGVTLAYGCADDVVALLDDGQPSQSRRCS